MKKAPIKTKTAPAKKMMNGGKAKSTSATKKASTLKAAPKKMMNGGKTTMVKKGVKKAQDGFEVGYLPVNSKEPIAEVLPYIPGSTKPEVLPYIPGSAKPGVLPYFPSKTDYSKKRSLGISDSDLAEFVKLARERGLIKEKNGGSPSKKMMNGGYSKKKMK